MNNDGYNAYVVDQLAGLGPVQVRKMFGGAGLYLDGLMFGLVDDARLYFRAQPSSTAAYEARGMKPFEPWAGHVMKGYWEVPADVLEDVETAVAWAQRAVADARAMKKPARKKNSPRDKSRR